MFVKYVMVDKNDYRGHVKLIVRNEQQQEIAYSSVESLDADMVQLTQAEVDEVLLRSPADWRTKRKSYKTKIDLLADDIRKSYLEAGYATIDIEYVQVENELNKWEDKGKPVNDVPTDISVWQEVTGQDLDWTVNDIKAAINSYRVVISDIRRVRLTGKKDIDTVTDDLLDATFNQVMADLEAMRLIPA